ncbi:MAG TPA: PxKF domain-containing protein [Candidatus Angelobacter sp.]|nr:PxKF domain-containing protein [Candidatus Angelobacter sp.]
MFKPLLSARLLLAVLLILSAIAITSAPSVKASANGIVISQIYGGGGNAGSTFKNDFIEIFNADGVTVDLTGWSVQYSPAAATTWQVTPLSGSLAPGQYFLIQESQGAGGTTNLPAPNATGTIAMSATAGKVALVSNTVALAGSCPTGGAIIDFIGYGTGTGGASCFEGAAAAPTLSNTTANLRRNNGLQDTDNNSADFITGAPNPRNTPVGTTNPSGAGSASPSLVLQGSPTLLTVLVTPGANPVSTGLVVTGNLSSIGGSATQPFFDDGTNGDAAAGNNTFSFSTAVTLTTTPGNKTLPISITDAQGRSGRATIALTVTAAPLQLSIHDIQGNGDTSPFTGRFVSTRGIVTGVKSNGFFIQNADVDADGDPQTSEGVFVFTSSAPTAAAAVGNLVQVTGTVNEFIPGSDPNSPPSTEISGSPAITLISTGNPLPTPVVLTVSDTDPAGPIDQLERFEGMRVHVNMLNVTAPTDGTVSEANATSTSNGIFYGVLPGIARPFREPGVQLPDPLPPGSPANVPRFDSNPELIRVDSGALIGSLKLDVTSGATVSQLTGPLDFSSRSYTILTDPGSGAVISGNVSATPVPVAAANELTIASFNMERFFDTINDPATSDVALTPAAFANRLNKASLAIRNVLNLPDIIGVEEMENLATLQAVADKVNADAVAAGQPNPNYQPFLVEGNDVGGIDVGLLVKDKINVISVEQAGKDTTFIQPDGSSALLNDRPPLVLTATASQPGSDTSLPFTMVVNHLRSLLGVDDPVDGPRVRAKRQAQAEFLANLLQSHQAAGENVISVCDCNAFDFNDGYVDILGTILGRPTPVDQVVNASPDLVDPDFTDLVTTLPREQQYSFVFNGSAQVLDHVIVNPGLLANVSRFAYARNDADFPEVFRNDPNRPERISDHDMPVAYITLPEPTPPVLHLPATITAEATSAAGAVVTYDATATDARDTNIAVSCKPASGAQFPFGSTVVSCSATNSRHKTAEGSFVVLVVDTTGPSVTVNGVSNGATYTLGAVPVASCSTTDFASGVAIPATLSINGGTAQGVGHFTATCTGAKDVAGNPGAPVSASYDVHYAFNGFLSPLTPGPSAGSFNAGRTLPLKWQLLNAQGRPIHARSAIVAVQAAANSTCQLGGEGSRFTVTPGGEDELEVEDGTYHLNWNTKGLATGCYSLLLLLDDGTTRSTVLSLR